MPVDEIEELDVEEFDDVMDPFEEPADDYEGAAEELGDKMGEGDNVVAIGRPDKKKPVNTVAELASKAIPKERRTTTPFMTKYERARVLGTRALQIAYVFFPGGC
jgi:DNA-directed RNA polymerase I, II, and III subunit RPABC2